MGSGNLTLADFPDEIMGQVFSHISTSQEGQTATRATSRRFRDLTDDRVFQVRTAQQQYPELSLLFNISHATGIHKYLLAKFNIFTEEIEMAANLICEERPHVRRDIVIQGLLAIDAGNMLRQGRATVTRDKRHMWHRMRDPYLAKVIRYTLRQVAYYLGDGMLDAEFAADPIGAADEIDYGLLKHAWETAAGWTDGQTSIAEHVYRAAALNHFNTGTLRCTRDLMGRLLFLRHICIVTPSVWTHKQHPVFQRFYNFQHVGLVAHPDADTNDEDHLTGTDTFDKWIGREMDSILVITKEFENQGLTGEIDYAGIGRIFRGEPYTYQG